jgi:hypothetical protein
MLISLLLMSECLQSRYKHGNHECETLLALIQEILQAFFADMAEGIKRGEFYSAKTEFENLLQRKPSSVI